MVQLQFAAIALLCLTGAFLAVYARKIVVWQVRFQHRLARRNPYLENFGIGRPRLISFEAWLLRFAGTVVALGSAVVLSLMLANLLA